MNKLLPQAPGPIGVFDSGYGGLTILKSIRELLPQYDYVYLGDNARAPYGSRSFDIVYQFTRQAVMKLFEMGCQLVILGCNTASAKALRSIQQNDLPNIDPLRRVLGVIRPTAEVTGKLTETKHVGILATPGTIKSESYNMEINKLWPDLSVTGVACPLWVPIVENNEAEGAGADYFVKKRIDHILWLDPDIDTLILGCTHLPHSYAEDKTIRSRRHTNRIARRICCRQPERLSCPPHRYGRPLHQRRNSALLHHRERRQVQGGSTHILGRKHERRTHRFRVIAAFSYHFFL